MPVVTGYTRPRTLAAALAASARTSAVVIGGGTTLNRRDPDERLEVIDLQALGLGDIQLDASGTLTIGATATLQQLADHGAVPPVAREAARREQPSTLRNQATVGGCIATGDAESELLAALLAYDAVVALSDAHGTRTAPLDAVLAGLPLEHGAIVTSVTIETTGAAAAARTGRTGADKPIVAAVARSAAGTVRLALSGVAARPLLVSSADGLEPPGDFRGSGEYRAAMAAVLLARVAEAVR